MESDDDDDGDETVTKDELLPHHSLVLFIPGDNSLLPLITSHIMLFHNSIGYVKTTATYGDNTNTKLNGTN